jgi:plasmid stability protein
MRTTIALDDTVFRAYKLRAAERGTTFAKEVEDTLRAALASHSADDAAPFELVTVDGGSPRPGVDYTSNANLLDLVDGEALRG